jgi:hypothetical protein
MIYTVKIYMRYMDGGGGDGGGDFGDFGVSFVATVAGRYTRWGGPRLSVQGEPLLVVMVFFFW